jgi:Zn-dependent peptidase ImmA (M78 family)
MPAGAISVTAWRTLIDNKIERLPVRPSAIARKCGVHIFTYWDYMKASGRSDIEVLQMFGSDGFTQLTKGDYLVFYNPCNSPARNRWTLAHELGHILLGHITKQQPALCRGEVKDFYDIQADNFAARLLCPEAIVHFCGVSSVAELKALTDLSKQASEIAWQGLCERRTRGRFTLDPTEQLLLQQFQPFIASYISEKINEDPDLMPPTGMMMQYRL